MSYRIGAYVRVSTDEQAHVIEGSLDSQQHRLKSFVEIKNSHEKTWGKIVETYIDDGFSAKDTRRPAYQRMLRDVRSGKINLILVTDFSRLSRNTADFSRLIEELESYKIKFLSVKEQFDTSTPIGELMVFTMVNLAQFERKQTSERVALNFHSRSKRGLVNGGSIILGYARDPENPGKLMVIEEEAASVRQVFSTYLEVGSLYATAVRLNDTSISPKAIKSRRNRHAIDGRWTVDSIKNLLTNYTYIGKREIQGKHKNENQEVLKLWQRHEIVPGTWPAIIDENVFYSVQNLIRENWLQERSRIANGERRYFPLSGVIKCGDCERAMIGQTSHGRSKPHRYYGHKIVAGEVNTCKFKRLRADKVEEVVISHLSEVLLRSGHLDQIEDNLRQSVATNGADLITERERVQKEIVEVDGEIESALRLVDQVAKNPDVINLIQEKLEKLAAKKKRLVADREALLTKISEVKDVRAIRNVIEDKARSFRKGWPKATPSMKRRLIRRLIEKLYYTREGFYAYFDVAPEHATVQPVLPKKMASENNSEAMPQNIISLKKHHKPTPENSCVDGVLSVVNGGLGRN